MEWFRHNSDRLFLVSVFFVQLGVVIWMTKLKYDEGSVDWARGTATLVLGVLLRQLAGDLASKEKP